jgi:hypothetical protein
VLYYELFYISSEDMSLKTSDYKLPSASLQADAWSVVLEEGTTQLSSIL